MSNWNGRTRRTELPPNWATLRDAAKTRAGGRCEATLPTGQRCPNPGTEAHHDAHRDNHHSLQWLCTRCHAEITQQQAADALRQQLAKARHPKRRPPGLIES